MVPMVKPFVFVLDGLPQTGKTLHTKLAKEGLSKKGIRSIVMRGHGTRPGRSNDASLLDPRSAYWQDLRLRLSSEEFQSTRWFSMWSEANKQIFEEVDLVFSALADLSRCSHCFNGALLLNRFSLAEKFFNYQCRSLGLDGFHNSPPNVAIAAQIVLSAPKTVLLERARNGESDSLHSFRESIISDHYAAFFKLIGEMESTSSHPIYIVSSDRPARIVSNEIQGIILNHLATMDDDP